MNNTSMGKFFFGFHGEAEALKKCLQNTEKNLKIKYKGDQRAERFRAPCFQDPIWPAGLWFESSYQLFYTLKEVFWKVIFKVQSLSTKTESRIQYTV